MIPFVISKKQRILQVGVLLVALTAVAEWRAFTPDPENARDIYQVGNHPIAVAIGTAFPAVILAPFAYWLYGWCMAVREKRRMLAEAKRQEPTSDSSQPSEAKRAGAIVDANPPLESDASLNDERYWAAAIKEFDTDSRRHGLYAKLYAHFEGDEPKIKTAYLKTRVAEMTQEAQKQSALAREVRAARLPPKSLRQILKRIDRLLFS